MDDEPEPKSKGEIRRELIVKAVEEYVSTRRAYPNLQELQRMTGIRSFNTLSNQLKILQRQGLIHYDRGSVKPVRQPV
jgi:DNA-binding HxlR family transcriptional regulator